MSRGPDADTLLARALARLAEARGCPIRTIDSDWTRWASATFTGARHRLTLEAAPCPALDHWLSGLPELEVDLRGHLLADLKVASVRRRDDRVEITLEALTVEEG